MPEARAHGEPARDAREARRGARAQRARDAEAAVHRELDAGDDIENSGTGGNDTLYGEGGDDLVYGDVGDTTEKTKDRRRVQYYLFLKVVEVETGRLIFQQKIDKTKQIKG